MFDDLNENNFLLYAAKSYNSPNCVISEFNEDFKRIKYLQYKNAVKKVDRKKFRDSDDEHQSESEDDLDGYEQEDGEMELEEGELEQEEPLDSS